MIREPPLILAPLRGVTIRTFRTVFAPLLTEAGFTEAVTPFIPANPGMDPLKDRELAGRCPFGERTLPLERPLGGLRVTPQFIGKDPEALRHSLERIKSAGYRTADLNAGCPFPMVRNKGRGSGLLRTPDVLCRLLEVGCSVMGEGNFSLKTRLGVTHPGELLKILPRLNAFPLRFLTLHARTALEMYTGACDLAARDAVLAEAKMPVVLNGDIPLPAPGERRRAGLMIGRPFLLALGAREDIGAWLEKYLAASRAELCGERPVLGRFKELLAYWKDLPAWRRRWPIAKLARTLDEIRVW